MDSIVSAVQPAGGYAVILVVVLGGAFVIAREVVKEVLRRAAVQDERTRADFTEAVARERENSEANRAMAERVTNVVEGNSKVIATFIETNRQLTATVERLDRHMLEKDKGQ